MRIGKYKRYKHSMLKFVGGMAVVTPADLNELSALISSLRPLSSGVDLIRLGPDGDGGYLIPNDLDGIEYAFSPGVSIVSGFEADLADRGMKVFMADYSVDKPATTSPNFLFEKKYVGCFSDEIFITLDDWKNSNLPDYQDDLILQMDIEGAEFETIMNASTQLLSQFRIMLIEFHYFEQLFNELFFRIASRTFGKSSRPIASYIFIPTIVVDQLSEEDWKFHGLQSLLFIETIA